jgi:hypothetical protein
MKYLIPFVLLFFSAYTYAQVKIGDNPNTIDPASILEMEDTNRGMLIPRMTTVQRDAISSPPNGLQVYNITTNTMDVYRGDQWESIAYETPAASSVYVYSLDDLPTPSGGAISLDANTAYIFRGFVDIGSNYLNLNGATLLGLDAPRDGVTSTVNGAILRSTDASVFMRDFTAITGSPATKGYDFSDATGTKFCNLFSGCSVVGPGSVGTVSGFEAVTITKNLWDCADGIKVTGNMGKFACVTTFITNLTSGAGIEFLSGLVIDDIDLSNNYFIYNGQSGVKLSASAQVDRGRLTTNMFRGVGTVLDGLTPYDIGWQMSQNTNIPNTVSYGNIYMTGNATETNLPSNDTYEKIAGTTSSVKLLKFESNSPNRLTYKGNEDIVANVFITLTASSPSQNDDFALAVAKNGSVISIPSISTSALINKQSFSLTFETQVDMSTDDYLEAWIKTTSNASDVTVTDLQFRVRD